MTAQLTAIDSWMHAGKPLSFWMWELVCDDMDRRDSACRALEAIRIAIRERDGVDLTAPGSWPGGADAVQAVLLDPAFDTAAFIKRVVDWKIGAQDERMRMSGEENKRRDVLIDRIDQQRDVCENDSARREVLDAHRVRVFVANCRENRIGGVLLKQQIAMSLLFMQFGRAILLAPQAVRKLLRLPVHSHVVYCVLMDIGPAGAMFIDHLLERMNGPYDMSQEKALAAVIRDDAGRIKEIIDRVGSENVNVALSAARVLFFLGERVREIVPDCVERLVAVSKLPLNHRHVAVNAIGWVTAGTERALDLLLQFTFDPESNVRGMAIEMLGNIATAPGRIVPRLIECLTEYLEMDPDWTFTSRHQRVANALAAFGSQASAAIPALVARLRHDEGVDYGIIEALGAIDPHGTVVLPILEKLAQEEETDFDEDCDPLAMTIRKLRERRDAGDRD